MTKETRITLGIGQVIGELPWRWRQHDHGTVGNSLRTDAGTLDWPDKCDVVVRPKFVASHGPLRKQIRISDGHDGMTVGVQQTKVEELDGGMVWVVHEFLEDGLKTVLNHCTAELQGAGHGTERVGNAARAAPQVRLRRGDDPMVFFNLPANHQQPGTKQQPQNPLASPFRFHA